MNLVILMLSKVFLLNSNNKQACWLVADIGSLTFIAAAFVRMFQNKRGHSILKHTY